MKNIENSNNENNNKNSKMQTITAISLIKYTSIRYKFFILCYCWNLQWNFSKN